MAGPPIVQNNKKNLLQLLQAACGELGIRQPTQVFGATDNQTIQLLALAQREGRDFANLDQRIAGWQTLRKQYVFNLVGQTLYTGTTTAGSTTITNVTPNPITLVGSSIPNTISWGILSTNIPLDAHITALTFSSITLDTAASSTGTDTGISIGQDGYLFPNDFGYYQTQTSWDRSFRWQMLGPLEAQEWQVLKSGISPTGPRRRFRIMGNLWYVDPVPIATETIVFEYFTSNWCQASSGSGTGGNAQNAWFNDTDYYTLDDDAFIYGIKWRWKAAKGLDFSQEKADYDMHVQRLMSRNGANRDLPLNAQASGIRLLNEQNVPDTGFGR